MIYSVWFSYFDLLTPFLSSAQNRPMSKGSGRGAGSARKQAPFYQYPPPPLGYAAAEMVAGSYYQHQNHPSPGGLLPVALCTSAATWSRMATADPLEVKKGGGEREREGGGEREGGRKMGGMRE